MVAAGFVRISTNPRAMREPLTPASATATVVEWFDRPHVNPVNPGDQHLAIFVRNLSAVGTGGNLVTDAHIAACAIEHDAEVHSADSDFSRFPGLRWHNPLQSVSA